MLMSMNAKALPFRSKASQETSTHLPELSFYDSPRFDHSSSRHKRKVTKRDPLLSSIFTENEVIKQEEKQFTIEGWNNKPHDIEPERDQYEPQPDLSCSSRESLLEGSCRQNVFKNELNNLSNGLFSMHLKDTQRNNISRPYLQACFRQNNRPVSVLNSRKLQGNRQMSYERRSSSYVVKEKGKEGQGEIEGEGEGEGDEEQQGSENDGKNKEKRREKGKDKEKKKKEKSRDKNKERDRERSKERETERERKEENKRDVDGADSKEIKDDKKIEKEIGGEKVKVVVSEKEKEREKEKIQEKGIERQQIAIVNRSKYQDKHHKEQEVEKREKRSEHRKVMVGAAKVFEHPMPPVQQNRKLYLKVIQMLEKTKRTDEKVNDGNLSSDALMNLKFEGSPGKLDARQQKIPTNASPPRYHHSNSCLTPSQEEQYDTKRSTKRNGNILSKKELNESNFNSASPYKDTRTPSKLRSTFQTSQVLPCIENNTNNSNNANISRFNSFYASTSIQVSANPCHKMKKTLTDRFSNSVVYPNSTESVLQLDSMANKNQSMILEDVQENNWKSNYHSQRTNSVGVESSCKAQEEIFIPYGQQEKNYQSALEPERKQIKGKAQLRSSSVTQSKTWGQVESKLKQKEGMSVKPHVYQLPLPVIPIIGNKEQVRREKLVRKTKRKDPGMEDSLRKNEEGDGERELKGLYGSQKIEYLRGGGIRGYSYKKNTTSKMLNEANESRMMVSQEELPMSKRRYDLQESMDKMSYLEASLKFMNDESTEEDL